MQVGRIWQRVDEDVARGAYSSALEEIRLAITRSDKLPTALLLRGLGLSAMLENWVAFYEIDAILRVEPASDQALDYTALKVDLLLDCAAVDRAEDALHEETPGVTTALWNQTQAADWLHNTPRLASVASVAQVRYVLSAARFAAYLGRCTASILLSDCMLPAILEGPGNGSLERMAMLTRAEAFITYGDLGGARHALSKAEDLKMDPTRPDQHRLERLLRELAILSDDLPARNAGPIVDHGGQVILSAAIDTIEALIQQNRSRESQEMIAQLSHMTEDSRVTQVLSNLSRRAPAQSQRRGDGTLDMSAGAYQKSTASPDHSDTPTDGLSARAKVSIYVSSLKHALYSGDTCRATAAATALWRALQQTESPLLWGLGYYARALTYLHLENQEQALSELERALDTLQEDVLPVTRWSLHLLAGLASAPTPRDAARHFEQAQSHLDTVAKRISGRLERTLFLSDKTVALVGTVRENLRTMRETPISVSARAAACTAAARLRSMYISPGDEAEVSLAVPTAHLSLLRIMTAQDQVCLILQTAADEMVSTIDVSLDDLRLEVEIAMKTFAEHRTSVQSRSELDRALQVEQNALSRIASLIGLDAVMSRADSTVRTLAVVADDLFSIFPVAALPWNGRPLVSHFDIGFVRERRPRTRSRSGRVFFGFEEAATVGTRTFPPLPMAIHEAGHLATLSGGLRPLPRRARDRKTQMLEAFSAAESVHFAGHALLDSDEPTQSGLVCPDLDDPTRTEVIALADLASLGESLYGAKVSLSACLGNTGVLLQDGRCLGIGGMLVDLGASKVAGFLWPARDDHAAKIFERFYRNAHISAVSAASEVNRSLLDGLEQAPTSQLVANAHCLQLVAADVESLFTPF